MHGSRTVRVAAAVLVAAIAACSDDLTDPASINAFSATMNGASVRPTAVSTNGSGSASFTYASSAVSYTIDYENLAAAPVNAAIRLGGPTASTTTNALALCGIGGTPACNTATSGSLTGSAAAASSDVATTVNAMRGFGAYVIINTGSTTHGEIRGNIVGVY